MAKKEKELKASDIIKKKNGYKAVHKVVKDQVLARQVAYQPKLILVYYPRLDQEKILGVVSFCGVKAREGKAKAKGIELVTGVL